MVQGMQTMLGALLGIPGSLLQTAGALSVAPVDDQAIQAHMAEHLKDDARHCKRYRTDDEAGGTCW